MDGRFTYIRASLSHWIVIPLVGRMMDMFGGRRTCWMSHENIIGYGDHFIQSTEFHPMADLARIIKDMGYETARLGVELENYYYSAKAHLVLTELPKATVIDATALVNWQRLIKSADEIAFIEKAARISEKVITTAIDRAAPGVRKNDLVADIMHAGITGVGDDWGDYPAIVPLTPSGMDATAAHLNVGWRTDARGMRRRFLNSLAVIGVIMRHCVEQCIWAPHRMRCAALRPHS